MMSIKNNIILFTHYTTCSNQSYIDVTNNIKRPHCIDNGLSNTSEADAKISFQYGDEDNNFHDVYLYKKKLVDIFIFSLNKARENKKEQYNYISNTVKPDERWMFRSHQLLKNNSLMKILYNKMYKINTTIKISPEKTKDDHETGRMIIEASMNYRLLFISHKFKRQPMIIKLNSEQVMELQTELYKFISNK